MTYSNKISPVCVDNDQNKRPSSTNTLKAKLSRSSLQNLYVEQYTNQTACQLTFKMKQKLEKKRKFVISQKQNHFNEGELVKFVCKKYKLTEEQSKQVVTELFQDGFIAYTIQKQQHKHIKNRTGLFKICI
eukprot:Pgem_evm1s4279